MSENDATEEQLLRPNAEGAAVRELEGDESLPDFRALKGLQASISNRKAPTQLPKRGEKTSELDTTEKQLLMIEESRQITLEVLSHERTHNAKSRVCALYDPLTNGAWVLRPKGIQFNTLGLWRKREVAVVDVSKGAIPTVDESDLESIERIPSTQSSDLALAGALWLHPEEAIHMVERGTIDMRICLAADFDLLWRALEKDRFDIVDSITEPMSLQGAYSFFLGRPAAQSAGAYLDRPFLTLEMYQVYAYLKRLGYTVVRATRDDSGPISRPKQATRQNPFSVLSSHSPWTLFHSPPKVEYPVREGPLTVGPILQPGLYRSYADIFKQVKVVPFYRPKKEPSPTRAYFKALPQLVSRPAHGEEVPEEFILSLSPETHTHSSPPLRLVFHVYKPSTRYKKTAEIEPDFRVAVLPAQRVGKAGSNSPLGYEELHALIAASPDLVPASKLLKKPPPARRVNMNLMWRNLRSGLRWLYSVPITVLSYLIPPLRQQLILCTVPSPDRRQYYTRLKMGQKNVIVAVVDCGITSFMRITDSSFGLVDIESKYIESKWSRGGKGGGGRGRGGRFRGRGRGKG